MKKSLKIFSILTVTLFSFNFVQAQTTDIDNSEDINIPSVKVVIDSVLSRNAMLKFRKQHIGVKELTLASEQIYWTRNFGIQGDTRYGNLNNFSTNGDGQVSSSILTTTRQLNYSIGFYVKIPIFDVLNRKNQLGLARLEIEEAKSMAQFQEDEIRQTVIKLYQELIVKQKVLKIRSKSLSDGKINMQMVDKEFRNGIVPVSEYVRITSITSELEVGYEFAKSEFIIVKKLLEDMAGFTFYK
jgi:outer membrane protein TolC